MPIYKPSELRSFLNEMGIFPKRGLSQNFLIDGNIIRKILTVSNIQTTDIVLEIGSGPGSLTQALLEKGAHVIAIEKDAVLAKALQRLQTPSKQLSVFCQDILTFPLSHELSQFLMKGQTAKVIANLPYHITTPILTQLAPLKSLFSSLTLMVQKEFAKRLVAQPGSAEYSSLTLFLQFYANLHYAFNVSRHCFYPPPNVDSAVVILQLREPPLSNEKATTFFQLTRTAFEQRRKMLKVSLKKLFSSEKVEAALKVIGQNPLARPENLSLDNFLQLHALLYPTYSLKKKI